MPLSETRVRVNSATVNAQQEIKRQPVWSWRHAIGLADVSTACKALCWSIGLHLNDTGEYAWPSRERLCKLSGLSERSLSRAFVEARNAGLLDCRRHRNKHGQLGAYRYYPRFPDDQRLPHQISEERQGTEATEEEVASQSPNWRVASGQIGDSSNSPTVSNNSPTESRPSATRPAKRTPQEPKSIKVIHSAEGNTVWLAPAERAKWEDKFGGAEQLDLVLQIVAGKVEPYNRRRRKIPDQVRSWLAIELKHHTRGNWREKAEADAKATAAFFENWKKQPAPAEVQP